ncbi:DUF2070 family protein [Pyrobaculum neutrophilum]|uniref:DUF2070 domain-containing protein n=1 Tax=Pyrobaculum neutrophilum (strain DSM 2338 / JCM 9278 / NBRC 100436 / V24Sta) TaxID=444157 RepID=B1YC11_PYRNV|nr:DUF2070 family protein [Pyrobaculum neutrophilum]ACB40865.1 conserved hypothetical protein [Pyrobaculum neutrophilum V24Sta]
MRAFERGYYLLFGRSGLRVALYATLLLAALAVVEGLVHHLAPLLYALYAAGLFSILLAVDRAVVNPRRSYYVAAVSTAATAALDVAFGKPPLAFALVGAIVSALVIQSLRCELPAFVLPLAFAATVYYAMGRPVLAVLALSYALVIYGLKPVIRRWAGGIDAVCMFSSFIYSVFAGDDGIEDVFRELGRVERVPLHVYLVGGRHVVVVSDFHPGPFRHIGGGSLVDVLNREVEGTGFRFTFLHGVGSHERDPVTGEGVRKIAAAVKSAVLEMTDGRPPQGVRPAEVVSGDVKIVGFSLGTAPHLAVVSRLRSASDDIPLWVAKRVNPGSYLLVDAQNKFDGVVQWLEEDVKALSEGLRVLQGSPQCRSFSVGVGKVGGEALDPLGHEIGPGGVSAIVNECDGERALLVVFDGNNLDWGLYGKIVDRYRRRGYAVVEVATTDTHRATGVGFGRGYRIVGEHIDHGKILEAVDLAVAEAERLLGPHAVSYRRVEVEAEVMGEEGFRKIQRAVRIYKRVGGLVLGAVFLAPTALVTLFA